MPIITGTVNHSDGTESVPCMDFTVHCVNKQYIDGAVTYTPPTFSIVVAKGEYVLEVTNASGAIDSRVVKALSKVGGGNALEFNLA